MVRLVTVLGALSLISMKIIQVEGYMIISVGSVIKNRLDKSSFLSAPRRHTSTMHAYSRKVVLGVNGVTNSLGEYA